VSPPCSLSGFRSPFLLAGPFPPFSSTFYARNLEHGPGPPHRFLPVGLNGTSPDPWVPSKCLPCLSIVFFPFPRGQFVFRLSRSRPAGERLPQGATAVPPPPPPPFGVSVSLSEDFFPLFLQAFPNVFFAECTRSGRISRRLVSPLSLLSYSSHTRSAS